MKESENIPLKKTKILVRKFSGSHLLPVGAVGVEEEERVGRRREGSQWSVLPTTSVAVTPPEGGTKR